MITTNAIVLRTYPILEKDTVLECFAEDLGRISVFIKFNQTKLPRYGGLTASFNNVELTLFQRKESFNLKGIKLVKEYLNIKKTYKKVALAYHFLEVISSVTEKNQENKEIYRILINSLEYLDQIDDELLEKLKSDFYQAILLTEGISSKRDLLKYNEKKWSKMIEYYSNKEIKELN